MDNKIKQKITQTHINGLYNIIVVGGDKLLKGLILQLLVRTNNIRYTHFFIFSRIARTS